MQAELYRARCVELELQRNELLARLDHTARQTEIHKRNFMSDKSYARSMSYHYVTRARRALLTNINSLVEQLEHVQNEKERLLTENIALRSAAVTARSAEPKRPNSTSTSQPHAHRREHSAPSLVVPARPRSASAAAANSEPAH